MGAELSSRVFEDQPRKQLQKLFAQECEEARFESGHGGYTGTIAEMNGIAKFVDRGFASEEEAEEYLADRHNKWDDAMAVSFFLPAEPTKRDEKAKAQAKLKAQKALRALQELQRKLRDAFKARKSAFVGCSQCKSRLATSHIKADFVDPSCPVCHASLYSKTDQARLEKAKAKASEAEKALREAHNARPSKKKAWLVGGWCSS